MKFLLSALFAAIAVGTVHAAPNGATACLGGMAAVGGPHLSFDQVTTGELADGGLEVLIDGVALDPSNPASIDVGVDYDITVSGGTFRGVLVRLEAPMGVNTVDALMPVDGVADASACVAPVVGISHFDRSDKQSIAGTLRLDEPAEAATLDVTVVVSNGNGVSEYYYTGFIMNAMAVPATVVDVVVGEEDLSTLVTAVTTADLAGTLSGEGPFTVFAPTNDAFAALDQDFLGLLLTDAWAFHLTEILLYHVAAANVLAGDIMDGMMVTAVNEESFTISTSDGVVLSSDLFTSTVIEADLVAMNGVVHKVDTVLLPSFVGTDIVTLASGIDDFSTLVSLVVMAGLEDAVATTTMTLLAPTNDAFAKLPQTTLDFLMDAMNNDALVEILTYHVIPAVYPSTLLSDGMTIETLEGTPVTVSVSMDSVMFNGATVATANVLANNGIVHVIDTVLTIPVETESPTAAPSDAPTSGASAVGLASSFVGFVGLTVAIML